MGILGQVVSRSRVRMVLTDAKSFDNNPHNGLCLSKTQDAAFDRGLLAFDSNYRLILSNYLQNFLPEPTLEQNFVAYSGQQLHLPEKFQPDPNFLQHHREEIFLG
jgi:putative restriction endonuclease